MLKKLIKICEKYIGKEETQKIVNETIEDFRKENNI